MRLEINFPKDNFLDEDISEEDNYYNKCKHKLEFYQQQSEQGNSFDVMCTRKCNPVYPKSKTLCDIQFSNLLKTYLKYGKPEDSANISITDQSSEYNSYRNLDEKKSNSKCSPANSHSKKRKRDIELGKISNFLQDRKRIKQDRIKARSDIAFRKLKKWKSQIKTSRRYFVMTMDNCRRKSTPKPVSRKRSREQRRRTEQKISPNPKRLRPLFKVQTMHARRTLIQVQRKIIATRVYITSSNRDQLFVHSCSQKRKRIFHKRPREKHPRKLILLSPPSKKQCVIRIKETTTYVARRKLLARYSQLKRTVNYRYDF